MIRRFCVAPMMDRTDRHERYFLRCVTKRAHLYTEMIHANTIIHGKRNLIAYDKKEHPLAIQVGGSDPVKLSLCAEIAEESGFKEINLNVGCPSQRVQDGSFGAILMKNSSLVAKCLKAMKNSCNIPVTVKCRIGVDKMCEKRDLQNFIFSCKDEGVETFIIHARKAWLKGLNPKQNREIPPLNYDAVYDLKNLLPDTEIVINGGIKTLEECKLHLNYVDGVMVGREAYNNPYSLREVDHQIFGEKYLHFSREEILLKFLPYLETQLRNGSPIQNISKHLMGLYKGTHLAKKNRKFFANLFKEINPALSIKNLISI